MATEAQTHSGKKNKEAEARKKVASLELLGLLQQKFVEVRG
jgi:hypothetical protein